MHGVAARFDDRGWRATALVVLMAIPALLLLVAGRLGPGMSPDSVNYASAARSLAESGTLMIVTGQPLTIFPPGLPFILGTVERLGLGLQGAAVALNILCAAACVLLSYFLAAKALTSRGWALSVAGIVSVSWSTMYVYSMLWTEPLFVTLTLVSLLCLTRVLQRRSIFWWEILLIGAAVSMATTIRFVGFTLLPVVALGVLFALRTQGWTRAAGFAAVTTGLSSLGLIFVAGRNIALGVSALGERSPSGIPVIKVVEDTAVTLGLYVYPETMPSPGVTAIVGVPLAALLIYGSIRALTLRASIVILMVGFTAVYWLSLWYGQFATTIDDIGARLTVPVFTPMLIISAFAVQVLCPSVAEVVSQVFGRRGRRLVVVAAVGLVIASLVLNAARSIRFARQAAVTGIGYNSAVSLGSPLALALRDLPEEGIAATNPLLAYWTSGRRPVLSIPRQDRHWTPEKTAAGLDNLKAAVGSGDVTFLAFFAGDPNALTPEALEEVGITLTLVSSYEDGSLYEALGLE